MKLTNKQNATSTINHLFNVVNQNYAMKSLVFVKHLGYTRKAVAKELKLSVNQVSTLINSVPHMRLNDDVFSTNYDHCINSVEKQIVNSRIIQHRAETKRVLTRLYS